MKNLIVLQSNHLLSKLGTYLVGDGFAGWVGLLFDFCGNGLRESSLNSLNFTPVSKTLDAQKRIPSCMILEGFTITEAWFLSS